MAGNRFGGNEYGGGRFGGKRFGGNKFGKSAGASAEKRGDPGSAPAKSAMNEASAAWKPKAKMANRGEAVASAASKTAESAKTGYWAKTAIGRVMAGDKTPMNPSSVKGTVRNTGAGYTGAKGDAGAPPAKSAKMSASVSPKATPKASAPSKPAYKAKGPADYNKDLGDYYLNATKDMFSKKAGGDKGKKK